MFVTEGRPISGSPSFLCARHVHRLDGERPLQALQWELLAEGKGVHCEVESEGSRRQTLGPTNRNRIKGIYGTDESAKQDKV